MKARSTSRHRAARACAVLLTVLAPGAATLAADAKAGAVTATDSRKEAAALLKTMAEYLSGLKAFSFNSQNTFEVVQASGQKIEFGESRVVSVARPDRLRAEEVSSDGNRDLALFDGKLVTVMSADSGVYAQVAQPPSVDDALVYFVRDLKMRMPLALMLSSQLKNALPAMVKEVDYVEQSEVAGKAVHHIAGRTDAVDFQFWIADPPQAVPLRVVITYRLLQGMPQYRADLSNWNTSATFGATTFQFSPPANARKVPFAVQLQPPATAPAAQGEVKP
jgi:hypothetical protein